MDRSTLVANATAKLIKINAEKLSELLIDDLLLEMV